MQMPAESVLEAYHEGVMAYSGRKPITSNPYKRRSPESKAFRQGYLDHRRYIAKIPLYAYD